MLSGTTAPTQYGSADLHLSLDNDSINAVGALNYGLKTGMIGRSR